MSQHKDFEALAALAAAPSSQRLSETINQAKTAGVSIFAILAAIIAHAGDIQGIITAILNLIANINPPATPPTP